MHQILDKLKICFYDGITLFVRDPVFIKHVTDNPELYQLQYIFDSSLDKPTGFIGRYRNFTLHSMSNSKGPGIRLGGSLHKWKNKDHNHDVFLWSEFLLVCQEFLTAFNFDPYQTDIWSLEGGLNNRLPDHITYSVKSILENTLLLKGEPRNSNRRKFRNEGYSFEIHKGECRYKFYDKGSQFNLSYKVIRTECNCKKRPIAKHGLITFADLLDYEKHLSYGKHLYKTFETLLIAQPEILLDPGLPGLDRDFLLKYSNTNEWIRLQKKNYYQFGMAKKRYSSLIDKYSEINFRTEILRLMSQQLN